MYVYNLPSIDPEAVSALKTRLRGNEVIRESDSTRVNGQERHLEVRRSSIQIERSSNPPSIFDISGVFVKLMYSDTSNITFI